MISNVVYKSATYVGLYFKKNVIAFYNVVPNSKCHWIPSSMYIYVALMFIGLLYSYWRVCVHDACVVEGLSID